MSLVRLVDLPRSDPSDDGALVRRILAGERMLYAVLMRRYNQRVFRVVRAIVRDDAEAEDVVQQAYVVAFDKLQQFRGAASFGTWLTRIAINEAYGRIRRATRHRRHLELVGAGDTNAMAFDRDPEQETQRREVARTLEKQIDRLPESLRLVLMMRDVEELDTAETARCLDISEEAVRTRLHRARSMMRDRLSTVLEATPDAFHFAGDRCDRIVLAVLDSLGID